MPPPSLTLAATVDGRWRPGIGDPTALGWLTVAAYGVASILCYLASRRTHAAAAPWRIHCVLLAVLGVNKAFDLLSWFTDAGRVAARDAGWYTRHGTVQTVLIAAVALLGAAATAAVLRRLARRRSDRLLLLATAAVFYQLTFVVIRAVSLHEVDQMLRTSAGPIRLNHLFEGSGLAVVILAALASLTTRPPPARRGA